MQSAIIRYGAILVAFLLAISYGLWERSEKIDAEGALTLEEGVSKGLRAELGAVQEVLETERHYAQRLQDIATKYEGDKNAIERQAADDLASLRDGTIRLRQQWQGCEDSRAPDAAAGSSEPDAATSDRAEGASDLVRAAAECDAQVRGLQAVIRSDRQ